MTTREILLAQAEALNGLLESMRSGHDAALVIRRAAELCALAAQSVEAEPVAFLCDKTRFKMSFDDEGRVACFTHFSKELDGEWVALVPAANDKHLRFTHPAPAPASPDVEGLIERHEEISTCLADDAAVMLEVNSDCETAANMNDAVKLIDHYAAALAALQSKAVALSQQVAQLAIDGEKQAERIKELEEANESLTDALDSYDRRVKELTESLK